MKRKILTLILTASFITSAMPFTIYALESDKKVDSIATEEASKELKKVTLNEVAHSIFYAPQYVAIENGYFKYAYSKGISAHCYPTLQSWLGRA